MVGRTVVVVTGRVVVDELVVVGGSVVDVVELVVELVVEVVVGRVVVGATDDHVVDGAAVVVAGIVLDVVVVVMTRSPTSASVVSSTSSPNAITGGGGSATSTMPVTAPVDTVATLTAVATEDAGAAATFDATRKMLGNSTNPANHPTERCSVNPNRKNARTTVSSN